MAADVVPVRAVTPVFVIGCGIDAELLGETLAQAPAVHSADTNAPDLVDLVAELHPFSRQWASGRLTAADASSASASTLMQLLLSRSRDRDDRVAPTDADVVALDWSAQHALRVEFLAATFPSARFVFVQRPAAESVVGALNAWLSRRLLTYPALPGWSGATWTGALVPQWRELSGRPLEEIVALQWRDCLSTLLTDLDELPSERWAVVAHDRLVADPEREVGRLCAFLDLAWDRPLSAPLRGRAAIAETVGLDAVTSVLPLVSDVADAAADLLPSDEARPPIASAPSPSAPFGSRYSMSFPELLASLGVSLLVSTYQTGRVILCRADGQQLNTHFRMLSVPMGIAVDDTRISVGTERWIVTYRNHPGAVGALGDERYDACYLPLHTHVTGNIQIHDLGYVAGELWAVSTRFSCLATFDDDHSFVPRWRPPFVSAFAPEDRCHLNGFTAVDGRVAYASALGRTDTAAGWREEKGTGGVVLDVPSGEPVLHGLSMPHSPRWYDGRLWVLESGKGTLGVADLATGAVESVAELPGFTRGLAFAGHYAFVGLSQVRESVFRGLPILDRPHRECGVWVVDLRTGDIVGNLTFTGAVQEIFDVKVLPWRWPELGELDGELLSRSFALPSTAAE